MERQGFLLPEQEEFVSGVILGMLKPKNKWVAMLLKMFGKKPVRLIDDQLLNKVSPKWKSPLIPIVDLVMNKDFEMAEKAIARLINNKINVPGLTEEVEQELLEAIIKTILAALKYYVFKEKQKTLAPAV